MRTLASFLVVMVLAGCSEQQERPPPQQRYDSASAHKPSSQVFRFPEVPDGSLTVLQVPLQAGRRVEMQRCFLWRSDRSESLHCDSDTDLAPLPRLPDDPPGAGERY
jgi:hypothetical protein